MKYQETKFEDYINSCKNSNLHKEFDLHYQLSDLSFQKFQAKEKVLSNLF